MGNKNKRFNRSRKLALKKDNLAEDRIIKSLEKKLNLKKKNKKSLPKSFVCDGLDYLLDVCDEETRKVAAESEKRLVIKSDDESDDDSDINVSTEPVTKKKKIEEKKKKVTPTSKKSIKIKKDSESETDDESHEENDNNRKNSSVSKKKKNNGKGSTSKKETTPIKKGKVPVVREKALAKKRKISDSDEDISDINSKDDEDFEFDDEQDFGSENEEDFGSEDEENFDSEDMEDFEASGDEEQIDSVETDSSEKKDGIWEDIYGRKRNKDGEVITEVKQKYIAPALRMKQLQNSAEKNETLLQLRRQMKGLLNKLAESNMPSIISQLDELYMSNSRNDMNQMLVNLMLDSIVAPVLTAERLVIEHMMCIAILHANVGTEVGAHIIMMLIKKFNEMIQETQEVENKELDNLVLMICHLYNFKVFGSQLIYQILGKVTNKFTEKEIEIILLILKTAGFRMRKDDPLALKELILNLQQKAATVKSSNSRIQFMLDVLLAIKNNNMNKIPQYDQSIVEHLKKISRTLIRKGNAVSQLNLSFEDLLNADERGKWWIVGSAWSGKEIPNSKATESSENKPVYSKKILEAARAQRMNTDARKNIFCVLMTAEDYLDAFEKLHHLGLKERQEREIVYVILNCCLQEKAFNPYYAVLLQKFCEYDRKYQMTIQYTLWDKFKMLNSYEMKQIMNMAQMLSYLFIQKALPLSILKVIELGELDKVTMKLFKKVMLDILLHENTETCLQVFERIAISEKLHHFREGLRLFINYFLLKRIKKEKLSDKQISRLQIRIELVDKVLMSSGSKTSF